MLTPINEIPKVFLHGETLESSELNAIISQINSTIRKLNTVETNLNNHEYDVSIPITNIYCRTKKGINAINFFPQSDAKKDELLEEVSNCLTTQGIKYNTNFSTVTLTENADLMNGVWTAYPQGVNESLPHEWEVSYKKLADNSIMYMFGPVLRSNYGYSGTDGDGVQYVYRVFNHELSDIERTNNTPIRPENPNANGEFIPSGWTDDPLGPTAEYPYEYVATLKRTNGSWGNFEKISLWSTYTEDGANGDFLTRVFCRFTPTALKSAPNTPIGGTYENPQPGSNDNILWNLTIPSGSEPLWTSTRIFKGTGLATEWGTPAIEADSAELDIEYSSSLEKPDPETTLRKVPKTPHPSSNVWHDPSEANLDLSTMIWRAERKIKNGQYNGEWVITKIVGQKGSFKSMVFRRFKPTMLQSTPPIPTGGNYNNPIPDGGLWFDGIPSGDSKTNGPVWASTRIFYDDGTQSNWSTPQLLADSEDLDIEFSPATTQPSNPTGEPFSNREADGWYDPSSANFNSHGPMIWRAERKVNNGQYVGNWTVSRILGEKGELGYRGDFVSRVFCRNSLNIGNDENRPTGGTYDEPWPTNEDLSGNRIWSDGIPTSGSGKIWTSTRKFYGDPNHAADEWSIPTIEADSNSLDIEYSTSVIEPSADTLRQTPGSAHPVNKGVNWYDPSLLDLIPIDPTTNKPYPIIWRAERRISGTEYDGPWIISRILGEEGPEGRRGSFKSCVFKRSNSVLSDFNVTVDGTEDGATYDSPIPNGSGVFAGWSDGIPAGDEILWMAVSKFTGNGNEHSNWTVTQQTDSVDLDIEFSPGEGSAHTCPTMSNSIFDTPIANYETNGEPPAITNERDLRNRLGWWDASLIDSQSSTMIWRAERKVHNLLYEGNWVITRILGEKGDPATLSTTQMEDLELAGLQIAVTPLTIVLEQSDILDATHLDRIENVTSNIVVYDSRTGNSLTNDKYWIKKENGDPKVELYATDAVVDGVLLPLTPLEDYISVTGADAINAKSITINNLPYVNNNGDYSYLYDKGFVRVYLEVSVGTSGNTRTIKIDIPWYLNKLGERIEKLRGDISETYLSRSVFSSGNSGNTIKLDFDAYINLSAKGTLELYNLVTTDAQTGNVTSNVPTLQAFGEFQRDATSNISKLNKSITGTNLLSDNWITFNSPVTIISDSGTTERRATKVSPQIPLSEGIYILSWYSTETSPKNFKVSVGTSASKISGDIPYITNNDITWLYCGIGSSSGDLSGGRLSSNQETGYEGDYYTRTENSSEVTYVRFYCKIIVNTKQYYSFVISTSSSATYPVIRPQLELCLATNTEQLPTSWIPGPLDFSSEIKLTADEITFAIAGPNKTLSEFKLTFDGISQTVSGYNGRFTTIELRLDSINLEAGVSENTLNKAGLYLRAGQNDSPSMVKVMAGLFKVVLPPEEEGDPEEIIFGNDPSTNTMVFSGDLKTGEEDTDYYNSYYHYLGTFPDFSTGQNYEKGECVRYNNKVYRFNEIHPSGAWKTGEQIDYEEINSDYLDNLVVNTNSIYTDGSGRLGGGHIYWNSDGSIYLGTGSVTPKGNNYKKEDFERNWYVEDGESTWNSKRDTVFDKLYGGRYASDGLRIINNFTDSEGNVNTTISLQADNTLDLSLGRISLTNAADLGGGVSVIPYTNDKHQTSVSISTQTGFVISRKDYTNSSDSYIDKLRKLYGSSGALTISYNTTPTEAASTIVNTLDEECQNEKDLGLKIRIKALDGNAYKGFTGEYDSMYFINGICIGPTSGFNNNNPFTTSNS